MVLGPDESYEQKLVTQVQIPVRDQVGRPVPIIGIDATSVADLARAVSRFHMVTRLTEGRRFATYLGRPLLL
jgi:hypothetical protein